MAKTLQHRRDTTANLASQAGSIGEFFMDTTKNTLVVMDGSTTGGHPLALESALYTNADVDTHLNQSNPTAGYVLSWNGSDYAWVAQSGGGGGGEFATIGTGNLYSSNLTNFATSYTTATHCFLAGTDAGTALTSGGSNIAIGRGALQTNTTGNRNIAIGEYALSSCNAKTSNIGIGRFANGFGGLGGNDNVAIGTAALGNNNGDNNVAIGSNVQATGGAVTGQEQVLIGAFAGYSSTGAAHYNTFVGAYSGYSNGSAKTNNTYIGWSAGRYFSGATNTTILGADTGGSSGAQATGSNNVILGYQAALSTNTVSNEITLGNSSISALRCQVTSITSLSDARDKKDIEDLPAGLDFVNELRPVKFTWNMRDGAKVDVPDTGFIAQDLQSVQETMGVDIPGLVYDTNPEKLEAAYGKLIPVLVKSIQELTAKVNELENKLK